MIDEAAALYTLAPGEFVAERNRLAKALKAAGRADDAQFVSGLKRPKLADHALNRLAHDHPAIIERLVDSIVAAADAQAAAIGGRAEGLREATAELRAATNSAVDSAVQMLTHEGSNGEGQRDDIANTIREFVANGQLDALRAGLVGAAPGDIDAGDDFFRGAPEPPDRPTRSGRAGSERRSSDPSGSGRVRPGAKASSASARAAPAPVGPSPADRARKMQLERQVRDAVGQVERAERAVAEAEAQLQQAQAKLDERAAVLDARRTLVSAAQSELDEFTRAMPKG